MKVTLINNNNGDIKEAYDTINDRNGKMIDGVFVKDEDLEE